MRFSCARCGQRYSTVDDPKPGHDYRIPCVVCGGMLLLRGADFPALPTSPPDPRVAPGHGGVVDAVGEEPLAFALAAVAARGVPAPPHPPGKPSPRQAPPPRRWTTVVAAGTVTLATVGAAFLLLVGGSDPGARRAAPAPPRASAQATPGGAAPDPGPAPSSATRPAAPSPPAPSSQEGGGAAMAAPGPRAVAAPPSPGARPAPLPPAKRAAAPVARKASGPGAAASAAEAPPAAATRAVADQVVAQAVAARRPAFDSCVREWAREEPWLWVPGRRVDLLLTVQPGGTVTSLRIDDPTLDGTSLAGCLRSAAGKPFPPFEGDPVQVRIPFRLGE